MRLHEYQAKRIFEEHGISIPKGRVAETSEEAREIAKELGGEVVVKAQVLVGGRGKAGGIKKAENPDEAGKIADGLIGSYIKGHKVEKVLVEEALDIKAEYYVGYVIDKSRKRPALILSRRGGMNVEEIAEKYPDDVIRIHFDPLWGLRDYQVRKVLYEANFDSNEIPELLKIAKNLCTIAFKFEAELTEINPLILTDAGFVAADARLNIDDNSLYRNPELLKLRDATEVDELEREAVLKGLNYVRIGGDIGIVANGAGLAMATMDLIQLMGGRPANFLDTGGGLSDPQKMRMCLEHVVRDENVKVVFVNIFAEITRCEKVAEGIVLAMDTSRRIPHVVKLAGTNEELGKQLLREFAERSGAEIYLVDSIEEGAKKAVEVAGGGV
ncbi:ADP-forming succinate--CoA ligase subunit beta [Geoglobus acetivorans]|uniref:Succinate--CoA ligase [ADP-forming] subunit beta n=1 Tax=Geoglobus acetivorans TaxID=565033 RepID=A0ABZ3H342_GEOAI|nr:ADP-forming succinate--CoA ligase subunit beta [Geoglobus acetivorans]